MALIVLKPEDIKFTQTIKYIQGELSDITEVTPMIIDAICEAVENGATYEVAALSVGIHPQTLVNWLKRGNSMLEKERTPLTEVFAKKLASSIAKREILSLKRVNDASEGGKLIEETIITQSNGNTRTTKKYSAPNVNADMWYLERKHPERWGKTTHSNVDITHTIRSYTDDELDNRIRQIVEGTDILNKTDIVEGEYAST